MRSRDGVLVLGLMLLAGCGGGGASTSASTSLGSIGISGSSDQAASLAALNALRASAGQPAADSSTAAAITSAIRHAGYQAIKEHGSPGNGLTHFETVDNTPGGTPDSANPLFTGVDLGDRMRSANGGPDITNAIAYYEDVATLGGTGSVRFLWNTVYHRVPMMRRGITGFGFGDRVLARASGIGGASSVPASGLGFGTCEFVEFPVATVASFWPSNGETGVETVFQVNSELPNPLPDDPDQLVGPPIHFIVPTTLAWKSFTVTVEQAGTAGTLASYILVRKLAGDPAVTVNTGNELVVDAFSAGDPSQGIGRGEIFVMTRNPLASARLVTVTITAVDTSNASFTTGSFSFTTR